MKVNKIISLVLVFILSLLSSISVIARQDLSKSFNEKKLRERIKYLSSDAMEGRGPETNGAKLATKYIADELKTIGVKGGMADGGYFQNVPLYAVKTDPNTIITAEVKDKMESFYFANDFVAFTAAQTSGEVYLDSQVVFVGYGIDAPNYKWNDYKGEEKDYRNKVLLMMVNDPPATAEEPDLFGGRALTYNGRWTYKFEEAARRGAVGVILIHTDESAGYGWNVVRTSNGNWRYDIKRQADDKTPFLHMRSWMTNDSAKRLVKLAGKDLDQMRESAKTRDFTPVNLGINIKAKIKSETKMVDSPNIVGIIEGSDAKLKNEYVVYTAHWDHLGIGSPNAKGDRIYNGALDNSTGVACLLGIAEVLMNMPAAQRPKRSSVFLFTTAEEQGLLGADYYTKNPVFPLDKTSANINIDSANIFGITTDFAALGTERSTLNAIVESVAIERNLSVSPDARPEQGSFFRSDHFPFAKAGIPAISMEGGTKFAGQSADYAGRVFKTYNDQNYHQASDEYDENWKMDGVIQEAEIGLAIGIKAANAKELMKFNSNDEFARAQKR